MAPVTNERLIVTRESPRVSVGFLTETEGLMVAGDDMLERVQASRSVHKGPFRKGDRYKSMTASVVSVKTSKKMADPAGTFQLELLDEGRYTNQSGFSWERIIRPNTFIWIDMQRPGLPAVSNDRTDHNQPIIDKDRAGSAHRVMVGFVDTVTGTASMAGGKPNRRVLIQGRDVGKLLVNAEIKNAFAVSLAAHKAGLNLDILDKEIPWGVRSPAETIKSYWNARLFGDRSIERGRLTGDGMIRFRLGPANYDNQKAGYGVSGETVGKMNTTTDQVVRYHMATPDDVTNIFQDTSELQFDGNYFNFFKRLVGIPFNEIFIDTRFDHENVVRKEDATAGGQNQNPENYSEGTRKGGGNKWYKSNVEEFRAVYSDASGSKKTYFKAPSDLMPGGADTFGTMFIRPCPWPWRGDGFVNQIGGADSSNEVNTIDTNDMSQTRYKKLDLVAPDKDGRNRWDSLLLHKIKPSEVEGYSRSRSDLDVFTWFWTTTKGVRAITQNGSIPTRVLQYVIAPPIIYKGLIRRYGVKYLETYVPFVDPDKLEEEASRAFRYTRRLADYYSFNFIFWNASLTIKGNPNIHIGDRVLVEHDQTEYYVESVSHDLVVFGKFLTSLGLTRGVKRGWWGIKGKGTSRKFFEMDTVADSMVMRDQGTEILTEQKNRSMGAQT